VCSSDLSLRSWMSGTVSVILPCRNEEKTIGDCIQAIRACFDEYNIDGEIIVSDSSTDDSAKIAGEMGVLVVKHGQDGYGRAYHAGFKRAKGDILVIGDADMTYDFMEMHKLLAKIKDNDLVVGSRMKGKILPGAMPWLHRKIGNPALSFLLRALFGSNVADTQSGFRAIRRSAWERLGLETAGMEFASEMLIRAAGLKMRVAEVPITYHPRKNGSHSKLRSFRDGWKHLRFMLLFMNGWLFILPGLVLILAGAVLLFLGHSILGTGCMVLGYQVILTGFFAKNYAYVHLHQVSFMVDVMNRYFSLGKGVLAAALLLGAAAYASSLGQLGQLWVLFLIVGLQTLFFAMSMSIIAVQER
jgi:glycosyltransferase involved in cell wall biosynthesis